MVETTSVRVHERFAADAPVIRTIRRRAVAAAEDAGATPAVTGEIALAVTEAATNAVLHAFPPGAPPGTLTLTVERAARELHVTVSDDGIGMKPRTNSPGAGMGLALMSRLSAGFQVRARVSGGTEVWMRFPLTAG